MKEYDLLSRLLQLQLSSQILLDMLFTFNINFVYFINKLIGHLTTTPR